MNKTIISQLIILLIISFNNAFGLYSKNKDQTLEQLNLFGEVFERIKHNYVEEVTDQNLIEAALNGMLTSLDPHSGYLDETSFDQIQIHTKGEFGGLGIEVTMEGGLIKIISPIDDTPAAKAGVQSGDYIIGINEQPVMGMSLDEAVKQMRGKAGTTIHLTLLRENSNEPIELDLIREVIKIKVVKANYQDNIAYIRITQFSEQTLINVRQEIENLKNQNKIFNGLILDLRNNPGGLLEQAIEVTDLFLDQGEIVSTKGKNNTNIQRRNATKGDIIKGIPMVILINGGSASASEIVAGALQDHKRAIIIGTKSFGKGSVQSIIPLSANNAIRLTTARYYTPSGRSIQAEGINPDIIVEPVKINLNTENKINKKIFAESSLKNHLKNEKEPSNNQISLSESKKQLIIKDQQIQNKNKSQSLDLENDFQLVRAIDLLKGLNIIWQNKIILN